MPLPVAEVSAMMSGRTGVSAPPLALMVSPVFVAVAGVFIRKTVALDTEATVVPAGMPVPVTSMPGRSPAVAVTVTLVLPTVVAPAANPN